DGLWGFALQLTRVIGPNGFELRDVAAIDLRQLGIAHASRIVADARPIDVAIRLSPRARGGDQQTAHRDQAGAPGHAPAIENDLVGHPRKGMHGCPLIDSSRRSSKPHEGALPNRRAERVQAGWPKCRRMKSARSRRIFSRSWPTQIMCPPTSN